MEIKPEKNDKIEIPLDTPVEIPKSEFVPLTNISSDVAFLMSAAAAPTYIPRTPLEHFFLYNNGGTRRLYVYDRRSGSWHYSSLT